MAEPWPGSCQVLIGPLASKQARKDSRTGEEEKEAGAVGGKREARGGRRGESAKNFAPNFVFHMTINTTQDRIGVNWTRVCKIFTML